MDGVMDGNVSYMSILCLFGRRCSGHIVALRIRCCHDKVNVDGLLEHIISNPERFGYWPHVLHMLIYITHIQ